MDYCSRAYLLGTNPSTSFSDLVCVDVIVSILYHTIIYTIVTVLFYYFWFHKCIVPAIPILFFFFLLIMTLGYPARLARAKSLLAASHNNLHRTQSIMDNAYATWYFIG